jgi:hypothetical protein
MVLVPVPLDIPLLPAATQGRQIEAVDIRFYDSYRIVTVNATLYAIRQQYYLFLAFPADEFHARFLFPS